MSVLDDIVSCYHFSQEQEFNRASLKQHVKTLILELIGDDYSATTFGDIEVLTDLANKEKAKLRQKVEAL